MSHLTDRAYYEASLRVIALVKAHEERVRKNRREQGQGDACDEAENFASKLNISRNDLETLVNAARHRLGQAPSNSATLERAIERTTEALDSHSQRHERIPVSNAEARRLQAFRDNR